MKILSYALSAGQNENVHVASISLPTPPRATHDRHLNLLITGYTSAPHPFLQYIYTSAATAFLSLHKLKIPKKKKYKQNQPWK